MNIVLKGIEAYEVVVDGVTPADDADHTEKDAFENLKHTASTIFLLAVSDDILEKIVRLECPHLMWTCLRTEYYRDSAFALVSQIMNLVSLPTQYSGTHLPGFICKFDSQWLHLRKLLKVSSDPYRNTFATFLIEDKAKRDVRLGFLVKHHKNVIDNLTTKDSFSYPDVKQQLMDSDTSDIEHNSALFDSNPLGSVSNSYGLPGCGPGLEPDRMVQFGFFSGKQGYPAGSRMGWNRTVVPYYGSCNFASN